MAGRRWRMLTPLSITRDKSVHGGQAMAHVDAAQHHKSVHGGQAMAHVDAAQHHKSVHGGLAMAHVDAARHHLVAAPAVPDANLTEYTMMS